jgi:cysteine desulfurase
MTIYLDHNSTTTVHPEVAEAMAECFRAGFTNPASQHRAGRRARQVIEDAREVIGRILGAGSTGMDADRIIFTSGGTEANNLALFGLLEDQPGRVIISGIEHPSVLTAAEYLGHRGFDVQYLRVNQNGVMDVDHMRHLLNAETRLVSAMLANNETGVLQPVELIAEMCRDAGVPLHTDAVQAVGKIPVHFRQIGATAMTLTAHKFHGPRGIGALLVQARAPLQPMLRGGFQQGGLRPGTESVELVVGLRRALEVWQQDRQTRAVRMAALRDRFEDQLRATGIKLVVNGVGAPRLPHTSNVSFPGVDRQALQMALDMADIACSTGSACASGSSDPSQVLLAMHLAPDLVDSALRFSLGAFTTTQEIDTAVQRISATVAKMQERSVAS